MWLIHRNGTIRAEALRSLVWYGGPKCKTNVKHAKPSIDPKQQQAISNQPEPTSLRRRGSFDYVDNTISSRVAVVVVAPLVAMHEDMAELQRKCRHLEQTISSLVDWFPPHHLTLPCHYKPITGLSFTNQWE